MHRGISSFAAFINLAVKKAMVPKLVLTPLVQKGSILLVWTKPFLEGGDERGETSGDSCQHSVCSTGMPIEPIRC